MEAGRVRVEFRHQRNRYRVRDWQLRADIRAISRALANISNSRKIVSVKSDLNHNS